MKKIAVLYGGKSSEHEVSIKTAFSVISNFNFSKYSIIPVYITLENKWNVGEEIHHAFESIQDLRINSSSKNPMELSNEVDLFFPLIHGPYGEDGTIQGMLEMLGKPYVGCGVLASSVGMDKIMTKKILQTENINQCKYSYYTRKNIETNLDEIVNEVENELSYPCFVKPANLGSSVGIKKAKNREELKYALNFASNFDRRVIVEEMIVGREVEIGVLGYEDVIASEVGEVITTSDFYDYEAKYQNQAVTTIQIPSNIPDEAKKEMAKIAIKAFKAIDGSGLSRVDFFWNEETNKLYLNEINTMPGFTPFSMYPLLFKAVGVTYEEIIDQLIQLALDRFEDKNKNKIQAESI
jgi:D-alanine-D-alanine ligase